MHPLVSVIIPAYNAEATLGATLESVLHQTYPYLEVIVVDDGSTDNTYALAMSYAARDPRLSVHQTTNGGVAAARNTAIGRTTGVYIAPIDADDIWHPERIAKHVAAIEAAGPQTAVVYSPFRTIDGQGQVMTNSGRIPMDGRVFFRHLFINPVGNGSGMLFRRSALPPGEPYSRDLRSRGAEGCEDYLLQLRMAIDYDFLCVPEYLIGYRRLPGAMSTDRSRMQRSRVLALRLFASEDSTSCRMATRAAIANAEAELLKNILRTEGPQAMGRAFLDLGRRDFALMPAALLFFLARLARKVLKVTLYVIATAAHPRRPGSSFLSADPKVPRKQSRSILTLVYLLGYALDASVGRTVRKNKS